MLLGIRDVATAVLVGVGLLLGLGVHTCCIIYGGVSAAELWVVHLPLGFGVLTYCWA